MPTLIELAIRCGTFTSKCGDFDTFRGNYSIKPTRNPSQLDWFPSSNQPFKVACPHFMYQAL